MHNMNCPQTFFPPSTNRVYGALIRHHGCRLRSSPERWPDSGSRSKARLALGSGFADPVVLVNTRPTEGECGSIGLEGFLARELRAWTSSWRSVRQECFPSKDLPLLPQPGLRGAGRKLAELWKRAEQRVRGQQYKSLERKSFKKLIKKL